MKAKVDNIRLRYTEESTELVLSLCIPRREAQESAQELKEVLGKGKYLQAEIKQYREKRSLNANSYFWVLVDKIAKAINSTPDEVYIEMLKRYGQREGNLLSVIAEGAPMIYRATKNHCTEIGESELNGKLFKHFAILRGSSTYDTKEMSILIDGIVQDARELGIETMTPAELQSLKESWGKK